MKLALAGLGARVMARSRRLRLPASACRELEAIRQRLSHWLEARTGREGVLLAVAATAALALLYTSVVAGSIEATRRSAVADVQRYDRLAARLRASAPHDADFPAFHTPSTSVLITSSAAHAGLAIRRLDPDGGRVGVALDDASFDSVIKWLAELDRDFGVAVVDITLERRSDPGLVNAQITLAAT